MGNSSMSFQTALEVPPEISAGISSESLLGLPRKISLEV